MIRTKTLQLGMTITVFVLAARPAGATEPGEIVEELPIGTVQRVPAVSVSLAVGSTDRDTKRVIYSPPPGWYIRSHHVELGDRTGLASYSVSTLAAGWQFKSSEQRVGTTHNRVAGQVSSHKLSLGGMGEVDEDKTATGRRSSQASHHAIVVEVEAQGGGFFRGGASIDLTVTAELVYLGKQASR